MGAVALAGPALGFAFEPASLGAFDAPVALWAGELDEAVPAATHLQPLIEATLKPCRRVLRDAKVAREDIRAVVMVGGSTRVPVVRTRARRTSCSVGM